jgi:hypothetical protein
VREGVGAVSVAGGVMEAEPQQQHEEQEDVAGVNSIYPQAFITANDPWE